MNEWNASNDHRSHPGYPPGYPPGYRDPRMAYPRKRKWIAGLLAFFVPGTGHFYLGQMVKGIGVMLLLAMNIVSIVFAVEQLNNVLAIVLLSLLLPIIYFYSLFDAIQSTDVVNERRYHSAWQAYTAPTFGMPGPAAPHAPGIPQGFAERAAEVPPPESMGPAPSIPPHPPESERGPAPGSIPGPMQGPEGSRRHLNAPGIVLLAGGAVVLFLVTNIGWSHGIFRSSGSMAGAAVLIAAGIGLWIWELRNDRGSKN